MREKKFRAWDKSDSLMYQNVQNGIKFDDGSEYPFSRFLEAQENGDYHKWEIMQFTGLLDSKGKEIYEGDIVGEESVYHFIDREGWKPSSGKWKIIGEKKKNFTGKEEERYISGYELKLVEWRNNGFEPFCDSDENCGHCGGGRRPTDFEVIGNIYEHSHLLK